MQKRLVLFAFAGALLLVGAGCLGQPEGNPNEELEDLLGITPVENTRNEIDPEDMVSLTEFTEVPKQFPGVLVDEDRNGRTAVIKTEKGDITLELYGEDAPMAVSNFIVLASTGFYDGLTFHRREEGFVIQGGDPVGTGVGGPNYRFPDELGGTHTNYEQGVLAMANAGPNTNGSQFFIMLEDYPLPNNYTIFGRVTEGQEVVNAIQVGDSFSTIEIQ